MCCTVRAGGGMLSSAMAAWYFYNMKSPENRLEGGILCAHGVKKKSVFWQNRRADHIRKTKFLAHLSLGVPKISYRRRRTYFLHNRRADHIRNTCFFAHLLSGVPKNQLLKKNRCVDHITNTRILVHLLLGVPKSNCWWRRTFFLQIGVQII